MPDFYDEHGRWQEVPGLDWLALGEDDRIAWNMSFMAAKSAFDANSIFSESLDYSPASLPVLDRVLTAIHRQIQQEFDDGFRGEQPSNVYLYGASMQWGAYLGEVLRLHHGFNWTSVDSAIDLIEGELPQHEKKFFHFLHREGNYIAPIRRVFKRFANDPVSDIKSYYYVLLEQSGEQDSVEWASWHNAGEN